jgi:hypothetical protein
MPESAEAPEGTRWQRRIEALEARLARAEAHQAISNLKSEYGALADARYTRKGPKPAREVESLADRLAQLFTEDAIWDGGGELGRCAGRDAIRARFCEPTLQFSWHFFVKPELRIEGTSAFGTWDVLALCTTQEGRAMWMVGVEHDEYACVDGRWLHRHMKLDAQLMVPYETGWAPASEPRPFQGVTR